MCLHQVALTETHHAGVMQKMPAGSGIRRPVCGSIPEASPQFDNAHVPRTLLDPTY